MKLEIALAFLQNLKTMCSAVLLVSAIGGAVLAAALHEGGQNPKNVLNKWPWLIPLILVALSPSMNDIWKIRLGLLKLELASPENIEQGSEAIGRIAEKLECKYLGCEEKKK